jgi:hypothetical protein
MNKISVRSANGPNHTENQKAGRHFLFPKGFIQQVGKYQNWLSSVFIREEKDL